MKTQLHGLLIGSNNKTHKLEQKKIEAIVGKNFPGFTLSRVTGHWQGKRENTALVEINTNNRKLVMATVLKLKKELKQDAIAIKTSPALRFI